MRNDHSPGIVRPAIAGDLAWIGEQELAPPNRGKVGSFDVETHRLNLAASDYRYLIQEDARGERVGFAILRGLDSRARAVELLRIVATKPGHAHGRSLLQSILATTLGGNGYSRLWLQVVSHNERAIRIYEQLGFVREGCLRRHYMTADGVTCDLIVFGMLREEYRHAAERLPATPVEG